MSRVWSFHAFMFITPKELERLRAPCLGRGRLELCSHIAIEVDFS